MTGLVLFLGQLQSKTKEMFNLSHLNKSGKTNDRNNNNFLSKFQGPNAGLQGNKPSAMALEARQNSH